MRRIITKLHAEHVRKYIHIIAKKKYILTFKGKKATVKDILKN